MCFNFVNRRKYLANVWNSRYLLSMDIVVTNEHKHNSSNELISIKNNDWNVNLDNAFYMGKILIGYYRVFPGWLLICRTIDDTEAKIKRFDGNSNVIISTPYIFYRDLKKENLEFLIIECDNIYDQMSNKEIIDLVRMTSKIIIKIIQHPLRQDQMDTMTLIPLV